MEVDFNPNRYRDVSDAIIASLSSKCYHLHIPPGIRSAHVSVYYKKPLKQGQYKITIPNSLQELIIIRIKTSVDYSYPYNDHEVKFNISQIVFDKYYTNLQLLAIKGLTTTTLNASDLPSTLTSLTLVNASLKEIQSPEEFPEHLQHLDIRNNNLNSLPITLPSNLRLLNVSNSGITTLPDDLPYSLECLIARDDIYIETLDNLNITPNLKKILTGYSRMTINDPIYSLIEVFEPPDKATGLKIINKFKRFVLEILTENLELKDRIFELEYKPQGVGMKEAMKHFYNTAEVQLNKNILDNHTRLD